MDKKLLTRLWAVLFIGLIIAALILMPFLEYRPGLFGPGQPEKMVPFTAPESRIILNRPQNWSASETPFGNHGDLDMRVMVFMERSLWPAFTIAQHGFPGGTLADVVAWGEARIDETSGVKKYPAPDFKTPSFSGKSLAYTYPYNSVLVWNETIRCQSYFTLQMETGYMLTFCAYAEDWNAEELLRDAMIASVWLPLEN